MIGIFGGTFDPVHFGHLRMAEELRERLALEQIRFIPAARPPHRAQPQASNTHRAEMVRMAIATNPAFVLDTRELERSGPSYTFDTLADLRAEHGPAKPLFLLLGGDAFLGLPTWHRWQELLALAHIVVAHRPGAMPNATNMPKVLHALWRACSTSNADSLNTLPAGRILLQSITALDISASAIRAAFHQGKSARYLLPESVCDYIANHRLYAKEAHGT